MLNKYQNTYIHKTILFQFIIVNLKNLKYFLVVISQNEK